MRYNVYRKANRDTTKDRDKMNAQERKEHAEERINRVYADLDATTRSQMIAAAWASIDAATRRQS